MLAIVLPVVLIAILLIVIVILVILYRKKRLPRISGIQRDPDDDYYTVGQVKLNKDPDSDAPSPPARRVSTVSYSKGVPFKLWGGGGGGVWSIFVINIFRLNLNNNWLPFEKHLCLASLGIIKWQLRL